MGIPAQLVRLGCAIVLAGACGGAAAAPLFQIVTGDDSELTRRIAEDLNRRLAALAVPAGADDKPEPRKTLVIAIGPIALRAEVARHTDGPLLSAYTSSQVCHAIVETLPAARAPGVTAVYAEPAPADQMRLVALLYRHPVKVAAILSGDTAWLEPELRAATAGMVLATIPFGAGDDLTGVLNRLANTQVLLAIPDRAVYNIESIRNILLSTYRHNQGVIGFSADMVKAGALASTYSDIEDIDAQIAEIVAAYAATGALPASQFPRYFRTIVNDGVAHSLNVTVDDAVLQFARHAPVRRP